MEIKSHLNYLSVAPRKVRLVADLISGMPVERAKFELSFSKKRASKPLLKLLNTAIADARHNFGLDEKKINRLLVKVIVNEGPKLKRLKPVSRGRAHEIQKKTSHVTLILKEPSKQGKSQRGSKLH